MAGIETDRTERGEVGAVHADRLDNRTQAQVAQDGLVARELELAKHAHSLTNAALENPRASYGHCPLRGSGLPSLTPARRSPGERPMTRSTVPSGASLPGRYRDATGTFTETSPGVSTLPPFGPLVWRTTGGVAGGTAAEVRTASQHRPGGWARLPGVLRGPKSEAGVRRRFG